jgi:ABC-type lipoprotein release transport system permease subunit
MGITALISTLLGFLGGVIPDLLRELRDSRAHAREVAFLRAQHEMQLERMKAEAGSRLREAEAGLVTEEVRAMREHLTAIIEAQAKPTGVPWVDTFNAVLRPMATLLILVLFLATASAFVASVIAQYRAGGIGTAREMAEVIWGSMIGLAIEGVLGFLFGVRSARKMPTAPV